MRSVLVESSADREVGFLHVRVLSSHAVFCFVFDLLVPRSYQGGPEREEKWLFRWFGWVTVPSFRCWVLEKYWGLV